MTDTAASPEDFLGHPKGLYVCFFTEMWERFSFYGMKALLLLYLIQHPRFTDDLGYNLIGPYGGLVYAAPVFGGKIVRASCRERGCQEVYNPFAGVPLKKKQ